MGTANLKEAGRTWSERFAWADGVFERLDGHRCECPVHDGTNGCPEGNQLVLADAYLAVRRRDRLIEKLA